MNKYGSAINAPTDTTADGDIPLDVRAAEQVTGSHDLDGLCETAIEEWGGLPNMGGTAYDAWNNWSQQGKATQGLEGIQPGDLLYWSPDNSNGGAGHASVYTGNGRMISATYQGVREDNINEWSQGTNQMPLGYVSLNNVYGNAN